MFVRIGVLTNRTASRKNGGTPRTRNQGGRGGGAVRGTSQPMQLQASIQVDKVVRFSFDGPLSNVRVDDTDLLDLFCVATSASAAYRLASAVRLRRIEMWGEPVSGGSSVSIEDVGTLSPGVGSPSRVVEDTTLGISRPAHILWRPRLQSIQSMWLSADDGRSLLLISSTGTGYLDLHVSFMLQDGETPVAVTAPVSGASVGQLYVRSLDGGGAIIPVTYPTI